MSSSENSLMDDIVLEKDIPIPLTGIGHRGGGKWQLLVASAQIGDSFTVPIDQRNKVHACLRKHAVIVTRKIDENTVRVWILDKK